MFFVCKEPFGIIPFELIFILSFNGTAQGEIGDRVVSFDGNSLFINIDGRYRGWAGDKDESPGADNGSQA